MLPPSLSSAAVFRFFLLRLSVSPFWFPFTAGPRRYSSRAPSLDRREVGGRSPWFVCKAYGSEAERYGSLEPSPHFLRCYNASPLLLEWCPGDDLFSLHGRCDESLARGYIRQALCCLDKCGARPHGDIKLENFLLGPDGVLKLIDFGPSGGSKNYLAPEMLKQNPTRTSLEGDLYAIGVCLYVLMAGVYPFFHLSEATWFKNVIRGTCAPLPATRALSTQGTQFMSWCLFFSIIAFL